MTVPFLYIDPGTGSMLFSVIISLFALAFFGLRAVWIKIKIFFAGKKYVVKTTKLPFVIYSEGKQYWNTFRPVLEEFENRHIDVVYYTSAEDDLVFDRKWEHVRPEFIGAGNRAFARLNLLEADVCLMTTPGLDVFQLKRSKGVSHYCHVLHMVNDATLYKRYGLDYFDSVLLSGDYQKEDIRYLEKLRGLPAKRLVTVGSPYLDVLAEKIRDHIPAEHPFTVLVSPSWGKSGLLSMYGEKLLDALALTGYKVIVRPHPQSKQVEREMLERLQDRYRDNPDFSWDFEPDNIVSLAKADIMISDFSSITLDYAFLRGKPFLSAVGEFDPRPYDAGKVPHQLWQFQILPKIGYELREEDFACIGDIIKKVTDSRQSEQNRIDAKEQAWQNRGCAGKSIVDFLVKVQQEVNQR
ncbi:MAG: CDP-glycerol glycerophosphotransferase family protein [Spirochaetia bacterium]|nr:CDP-glycerol glycerophosphotransferase family protein [Spirochaetia bacterium]